MTDKMVDVGGRRRPARHFLVEFSDVYTNVDLRRRPECRPATVRHCRSSFFSGVGADTQADVGRRRRRECRKTGPTMSAADTRRHSVLESLYFMHPAEFLSNPSRTRLSSQALGHAERTHATAVNASGGQRAPVAHVGRSRPTEGASEGRWQAGGAVRSEGSRGCV